MIDCFGMDYVYTPPSDMVTSQKESESENATPLLMKVCEKRLAVVDEVNKNKRINPAFVKSVGSNEWTSGRYLQQGSQMVKPQYSWAFLCNQMPKIDADDGGLWRRIVVVELPYKFVETPDPQNPIEKQKDDNVKDKLKVLAPHFMNILLDYYKKYQIEKLVPTKNIKTKTLNTRFQNDHSKLIISKLIVKNTDHMIPQTCLSYILNKIIDYDMLDIGEPKFFQKKTFFNAIRTYLQTESVKMGKENFFNQCIFDDQTLRELFEHNNDQFRNFIPSMYNLKTKKHMYFKDDAWV